MNDSVCRSFGWFSSISLSVVVRLGSSCRSVAGSVGSVVRSVRSVCRFAVADQFFPNPDN